MKCIKDLNVRLETIKLLEESIGENSSTLVDSGFLDMTPKAQAKRAKINASNNNLFSRDVCGVLMLYYLFKVINNIYRDIEDFKMWYYDSDTFLIILG